MKIAFLTRNYPPDTLWGGDAVVYYNLARGLARLGHEVHVICQAVGKPKDCVEEGVFVHRVGTNPKRYSAIARINYSVSAWLKLRGILTKCNIEIVEAPDWSADGFFYSLRKRTPLIITALGSTDEPMGTKNFSGIKQWANLKALSLLANLTLRKADRVIASSNDSYQAVIQRYHIAPQKVELVPIGIDTEGFRFVTSNIRHKLGIHDNAGVVLFVGRLELRNGVHILCQAIPQIIESQPDAKFILLGRDTPTAPGGGSFKHYIMDKAHSGNFQNNIMLIDFLPENELVQLYSASDVCLYPALTSTFGLPVMEAMACGKPVITTPVGIVPELEPYALDGLKVVPVNEAGKLAQAIIEFLLTKDEDKERIAQRNREVVESAFSIPTWIDKMVKVYEGLLGKEIPVEAG